ncbi:MAG: hypothetical protein KAU31_02635, partial [Spirochaetaceae bacterium]|nr:hypothetical protein [Spirochaetaceae bacterium]
AIHQHNETAGILVFQVHRNEEAEVVVQGDVYPGTCIEICHVSFVVPKQLRNVCFKLDKAKGKVITENLVDRRRK